MAKTDVKALEARVATLEREVAALKAAGNGNGTAVKDWRSTVGMFAGDEVMKRIDEEARKFREADREKARRRYAKQSGGTSRKPARSKR